MKKIKIAIGLPTNRGIRPKTALSLMKLISNKKYDFEIIVSTKGFNTAENRNWITVKAINSGCTHLLLTDDDMIYSPDVLDKLLKSDKDIIGAKYSIRRTTGDEVIEYFNKKRYKKVLFKCKALGGGMLLIKIDVFNKVQQPWFGYKWHPNGMVKMSNDWFFCEKAIEKGLDVWCDPTLEVNHLGDYEY